MKSFNLNSEVLVEITDYGWEHLALTKDRSIRNSIKKKEEIVNGKKYYRIQAHDIITYFGDAIWLARPCPININILIPESNEQATRLASEAQG